MNIQDVLQAKGNGDIIGIDPEASVTDAVGKLVEHHIGSLVVMRDGRMVGLLCERDILRGMHTGGCSLCDVKAGDLMEQEPLIVSPEDSVDYARDVMTRNRVSHLVVMDGDRLLNVISFHDLARAMLKEVNFQNDLLKRYIKNWPE
jgi:CBS domain-containing protein